MMRLASIPRSRTDIRWIGSGQPLELAKVEFVMPSWRARSFINWAKPASDRSGLSASAMTALASLPDSTMIPFSNSSTVTVSVVSRNMVEPP